MHYSNKKTSIFTEKIFLQSLRTMKIFKQLQKDLSQSNNSDRFWQQQQNRPDFSGMGNG
jgi:hypothetical protein